MRGAASRLTYAAWVLACLLVAGCQPQLQSRAPAASVTTQVAPPPAAPAAPGTEARLLFKSGFEEGVVLTDPQLRFGQWRQQLRGADQGYEWSTDLLGSPVDFQYLVSGNDARDVTALHRFVETRIDSVVGHDGRTTRALFQALRGKGTIGQTQNDFIVFDMQNAQSGYVRCWVKLQPNLLDLMTQEGDWRVLFEWKETPAFTTLPPGIDFQYRWLVMISRRKPTRDSAFDGLAWKVEGDVVTPEQAATGTPWTDDWTIWNNQVRVPLGEWFPFEVQWKLDPGSGGRLVVWVDGQVVADHRQRTQVGWSRGKLYLFENYMGAEPLRRGEAYQWVDEFELWSDLPPR